MADDTKKVKFDWKGIAKELGGIVSAELKGVLEGAEADIQTYGQAIADSLVGSVSQGRDQMTEELKGQLRALAEVNRIRANDAGWKMLESFLAIAARTITTVLAAAAPGLAGAVSGLASKI